MPGDEYASGSYEDDIDEEFIESGSSEEEDSEDIYDMREAGALPQFQHIQKQYKEQLQREEQRSKLAIRGLKNKLSQVDKHREDMGVQLYSAQHQLSRLQLSLEKTMGRFTETVQARVDAEEKSVSLRLDAKDYSAKLKQDEIKFFKFKSELDDLQETARQMKEFNEGLETDVAVLKRRAYATEKEVATNESTKAKQDFYIDSLNQGIKNLREKITLYKAQLEFQQKETKEANNTVTEAMKEMEKISFEKKQLMQQWKASVVGIQRRDEALEATNEAVTKEQETGAAIQAEINGYQADIRKGQQENEDLHAAESTIDNTADYLSREIETLSGERDQLLDRYDMLKKSLEHTEEEENRLKIEQKQLRQQVKALEQNYLVVEKERQTLLEGIAATDGTSTTVSKAVQNLKKQAKETTAKVYLKQNELIKLENEIARMQVDVLNTRAHNDSLRQRVDECLAELAGKDKLIRTYELEIRQRNDEVDKKIHTVDRLNRRYEQLTADKEDANLGPLEATIKNMAKQIEGTKKDSNDIQRDWLSKQTQLVDTMQRIETLNDKIHSDESKLTIYNQKRIRIDKKISTNKMELQELKRGVESMHTETARINTLIAKNTELREKLAAQASGAEQDFVAELHAMQEQSIRNDAQIKAIRTEKDELRDSIVDLQRQIGLWERKLEVERETQKALDPSVGQASALAMEKEIHRMQLRFTALQKKQGKMLKDMETAIAKRDVIVVGNRGKKKHAGKAPTKTAVRKKCKQLKKQLTKTEKETNVRQAEIVASENELQTLEAKVSEGVVEQEKIDNELNSMQEKINDLLYQKQRSADTNAMLQRLLQQYKQFENDENEETTPSAIKVVRELQSAEEEQQAVLQCISTVSREFPHLAQILESVGALAKLEIPI
jgi:chromosome segregation ATPase